MKVLLTLSLGLFAVGAFSADESLSTMKSNANSHITQKISTLNSAQSCINSASTVQAFKACKYDMKEDMMKQKAQMMEEKKSRY